MKQLCTFLFLTIHFQVQLSGQTPLESVINKEIKAPLYLSEMAELNCKKIWFDTLLNICDSSTAIYVQQRCRADAGSVKGRLYLMDRKDNLISEIEVDDVNNVRGRVGEMPGDTCPGLPGEGRFSYYGPSRTYYKNGQLKRDDYYINGFLVRKKCFTALGLDTTYTTYFPFFGLPEFPGDSNSMQAYIQGTAIYPEKAKDKNIEGLVLLRVRINTQGEADEIEVLESPHNLLSDEAIRVVKSFPKFKPANLNKVPFDCHIRIPIQFNLNVTRPKQSLKPEEILTKKSFRKKS
jgi:TonB family protein